VVTLVIVWQHRSEIRECNEMCMDSIQHQLFDCSPSGSIWMLIVEETKPGVILIQKQSPQERPVLAKRQKTRAVYHYTMRALKLFFTRHCCNHTQHHHYHFSHSAFRNIHSHNTRTIYYSYVSV